MWEATTVEELENFSISSEDVSKALKIGKDLSEPIKGLLKNILTANLRMFTWKHADMMGIESKVTFHANIKPNTTVDKLLKNAFISLISSMVM